MNYYLDPCLEYYDQVLQLTRVVLCVGVATITWDGPGLTVEKIFKLLKLNGFPRPEVEYSVRIDPLYSDTLYFSQPMDECVI